MKTSPSLEADPSGCTLHPAHVTCDACWEADPSVNGMTHRCKNITLSQTLLAGGNYAIAVSVDKHVDCH